MPRRVKHARILSCHPPGVVDGGRLVIAGEGFSSEGLAVTIGDHAARVAFASPQRLVVIVPQGIDGGPLPVRLSSAPGESPIVQVGMPWATGLHQVDNPVFDRDGNLYVTYSGSRGQESPVSIFRVTRSGNREPFASGIVNPTSLAMGPDGHLYVSSRFEGAVYRVGADGSPEQVASDLGVACGIAFDGEGWMYVGDRSGTIFRVRDGRATAFATIPASVAAFHLAMGPDGDLCVTAPTLSPYDVIFKIGRQGQVTPLPIPFGRPQGLAFSPDGVLHVVEALAGSSGLYRVTGDTRELLVAGASLVGVAFGPGGELVVASNETAYLFPSQSFS